MDNIVEILNSSMFSLTFIAVSFSSCRVTEENLLFETVLSGPPSFF